MPRSKPRAKLTSLAVAQENSSKPQGFMAATREQEAAVAKRPGSSNPIAPVFGRGSFPTVNSSETSRPRSGHRSNRRVLSRAKRELENTQRWFSSFNGSAAKPLPGCGPREYEREDDHEDQRTSRLKLGKDGQFEMVQKNPRRLESLLRPQSTVARTKLLRSRWRRPAGIAARRATTSVRRGQQIEITPVPLGDKHVRSPQLQQIFPLLDR